MRGVNCVYHPYVYLVGDIKECFKGYSHKAERKEKAWTIHQWRGIRWFTSVEESGSVKAVLNSSSEESHHHGYCSCPNSLATERWLRKWLAQRHSQSVPRLGLNLHSAIMLKLSYTLYTTPLCLSRTEVDRNFVRGCSFEQCKSRSCLVG